VKRLVVLLVVVALLLVAGGVAALVLRGDEFSRSAQEPSPTPSTSPSPSPSAESPTDSENVDEPPSPDLAEFYSQDVRWKPCQKEFECATLEVPLDYDDPGGRAIDLALLKVPAADPEHRVGSLVVNPGGPGQPGTTYAAQSGLAFDDPLLDGFDLVGFDPRGTGRSTPVDCVGDRTLDELVAADPDPDTVSERRELVRGSIELVRGCVRRSGALAAHVSTIEAARDMDVIRAVLGEATLSYFGASYGTELGATYAELFPERVGRFVLDGAVDLTLGTRELAVEQAAGFETALRAYVRDCVETVDSCVLGDSVEEGLSRISDLLDQVDDRPLPTSSDRELKVGNAFYGIVLPLYVEDYWFLLSAALGNAFGGDGSALLQLSDLYNSRGPEGYTDNSREAFVAISCLDDPTSIPPGRVPAEFRSFEKASPTFGRVFAWGLIGCRGATAGSARPLEVDGSGAAPIVVIGTTRDPATPYAWARSLADQLDSGVLVTRDGDGHTGYFKGNECVDDAVHAYLLDGKVPRDGLTC
jgi:pimeloyl-ACP methyl ester carboxylesterase